MNAAAYNDRVVNATIEDIRDEHQKDYTPQEAALVADITKGRVVWEYSFVRDYWIYLKNNHILLGIFLAHPLHPYSKKERALVVICGLFMAFFVAAAANSDFDWLSGTDLVGDNKSIVYGIFIFIYNLIMREVATCSCVQQKKKNYKTIFEGVGYVFLFIGVALSLILLVLGALALRDPSPELETTPVQVVESFFISQASSWMYGFGFAFLFFTFYRFLELRKADKADDGLEFIDKNDAEVSNQKTAEDRLAARTHTAEVSRGGSSAAPSVVSTMNTGAHPALQAHGSLVEVYKGDVSSDDEDDDAGNVSASRPVQTASVNVNPVPTNSRSQPYQPQAQYQAQQPQLQQPLAQQPQLQQPMYGQPQQQFGAQPQVQMAYGQQRQQPYGVQPQPQQQAMYNPQYGQQPQPQNGYNQYQG